MSSPASGRRRYAVTLVTLLLSLILLAAGSVKLLRLQLEIDAFNHFDIPLYLLPVAGLAEVAAAILLVIPRLAALGGVIGAGVMVVAIAAHLHVGELPQAIVPLTVLSLCVLAGWARRGDLARTLLGSGGG